MRQLTASQKIAQLEHSIARLEKSASRFDSLNLEVVASAAEDVALMVNARFNAKSSTIRKQKRGKTVTAFFNLLRGREVLTKVFVRKTRNRLVAFMRNSTGFVELGNVEYFTADSQSSVRELLESVRFNLKTDSSIDLYVDSSEI